MMVSRELVRRAIRFGRPERLPFTGSMGSTDFSGDTVAIFPDFPQKWWLGDGGADEWGCQWELAPDGKDMGQVKNVMLERLEDWPSVKLPAASNPARYAHWDAILTEAERQEKYVVLCNGPYLFERAHFLHGFAATLEDIALEPETFRTFLGHIARYHLETIAYVAEHFPGRVHGYRGTDDWGTQQAAMISPTLFREVFQPVYRELFGAMRAAGMDAWMHSCGNNLLLLEPLIEAGLQVANLMQPNVFPIPRLAAFRGRLCFEVCADAQTTLPGGDREALSREIAGLLEACCTADGGLIEVKLDEMYFDADGVAPATGVFCHAEYRRRDPFIGANHGGT